MVDSLSSIRQIDKQSVHKICSGQVISDLSSAIKELIENALDANATTIEIKLKDMGLASVEVIDNGCGITSENHESIALKHHTSKIEQFSDLDKVRSFGFRGEALNALCELCESLTITTKPELDSVGSKLVFARDGSLLSTTASPRSKGTSVVFTNLFHWLPVRKAELIRNIKKQYHKLLRLLQAYAVISTGVRFVVNNTRESSKHAIIATEGKQVASNISSVFGSKFLSSLIPIEFHLAYGSQDIVADMEEEVSSDTRHNSQLSDIGSSDDDHKLHETAVKESSVVVEGFISKVGDGVGRSDNDRQFIYCNGRPVDIPKLTKAANEVWRRYEMKSKPAFILNMRVPQGYFDVNMSPDKREIVLAHENEIMEQIKLKLDALYAPSKFTFMVSQLDGINPPADIRTSFNPTATTTTMMLSSNNNTFIAADPMKSNDMTISSVDDRDDEDRKSIQWLTPEEAIILDTVNDDHHKRIREVNAVYDNDVRKRSRMQTSSVANESISASTSEELLVDDELLSTARNSHRNIEAIDYDKPPVIWNINLAATERPVKLKTSVNRRDVDMLNITFNHLPTSGQAIDDKPEQQAESILSRTISKQDFLSMRIIGQFNLGFIIAELRGDLYILDQHACDEKFKFETLQRTTTIHQQALLAPLVLEASAAEEEIIRNNISIFQANGFKIRYHDHIDDHDVLSDKRIEILAIPFSKGIEFGIQDVHELASMLMDRVDGVDNSSSNGLTLRNTNIISSSSSHMILPKFMTMFASRACRSAVMIGTALQMREMRFIVDQLSTIEQPWNCPHGRPTMRHLSVLTSSQSKHSDSISTSADNFFKYSTCIDT